MALAVPAHYRVVVGKTTIAKASAFCLKTARGLADTSRMNTMRSCDSDPQSAAAWSEGYEAAVNDAIALIDSMGGSPRSNLSAPVLQHLKARLLQLQERERHGAA